MCATPLLLEALHPFLTPRGGPGGRRDGVTESTMDGCGSRYSRVHRLYHSGFLTPFKADGIGTCVGDGQALYEQSSAEPSPKTWEVFLVLWVS